MPQHQEVRSEVARKAPPSSSLRTSRQLESCITSCRMLHTAAPDPINCLFNFSNIFFGSRKCWFVIGGKSFHLVFVYGRTCVSPSPHPTQHTETARRKEVRDLSAACVCVLVRRRALRYIRERACVCVAGGRSQRALLDEGELGAHRLCCAELSPFCAPDRPTTTWATALNNSATQEDR